LSTLKTLYPSIEPFRHFYLSTDSSHRIYVEQSGNPHGIPVIFLHGGPCSGTQPSHRCFFNPEQYHIILFDQRGCGRSTPFGLLEANTTEDLMTDMERIRQHLGIEQWLLFGGSWGATLALLYAQRYSNQVNGMIIRGVFLARQQDLDWFGQVGAGRIYPEKWQQLATCLSHSDVDTIPALYQAILGEDEIKRRRVAKAWINWGGQVALLQDYCEADESYHVTEKMVQQVQMELHYAQYRYFIEENQILNQIDCLPSVPIIIIHGRLDLVCPIEAGYRLSQALPDADFQVLPHSGHVARGEEMINALVQATDTMAIDLNPGELQ